MPYILYIRRKGYDYKFINFHQYYQRAVKKSLLLKVTQ